MDLPSIGLAIMSQAVLDGELKYGYRNWRAAPISCRKYIDAMRRHLALFEEGQELSSEGGIHHLGHIGATCAIVLDAIACGTFIDDREKAHTEEFIEALDVVNDWTVERRKKAGNTPPAYREAP